MSEAEKIIAALGQVGEDPNAYARKWKQAHGRKVIGTLPMNFPKELVHAAGALPVTVQDSRAPFTLGRGLLYEFYCGYTRSLVDQAAIGQFDVFDGFVLVDHCVALLGAVDAIRFELPNTPVFLAQFTASMDEPWTRPEIRRRVQDLKSELEAWCNVEISDRAISNSIRIFNENRMLLRSIYDLRRSMQVKITARDMQALVKSSMVMDVEEHTERLTALVKALEEPQPERSAPIKLHLSGHFCHAPRGELLDLIEECGARVVDDDLFTGLRYIATDVSEVDEPIEALTRWYFDRNTNVPCATRAQKTVDWEKYLVRSLQDSRADGVVVLMPKFCEPHMLYYPELRKELIRSEIPHLLIETEHEGLAVGAIRTRVEALLEGIRRKASSSTAAL
jgi:bcr-type benzoyl-CoA reductase subunit C